MQYKKVENGFLLRLEKGEEVTPKLASFIKEQNINSGFIYGLGAILEIELGYYNLEKKEYIWKKFVGAYEIASLTGNISKVDDEPFIHMHGVFTNKEFISIGGHIKNARVGATCEIYITNFKMEISRKFDKEIALKLLDLE